MTIENAVIGLGICFVILGVAMLLHVCQESRSAHGKNRKFV